MEKLKVILDWFPNTNHTGYLLAQKRGWFEEAGLDVEICGEVHGGNGNARRRFCLRTGDRHAGMHEQRNRHDGCGSHDPEM